MWYIDIYKIDLWRDQIKNLCYLENAINSKKIFISINYDLV